MSKTEPTTQYEALRRAGAPKLPEGYGYVVNERNTYGDRTVTLVILPSAEDVERAERIRYATKPRPRYVDSFTIDTPIRWMCLGEKRAIVFACWWLKTALAHSERAEAREAKRNAALKVDGPLR